MTVRQKTVRQKDDGVIRLLLIGRDVDPWRRDLQHWEGRSIEVDTEVLPAAGVRNFSETTPDAVGIAEPDQSPRIEPIAAAIRERPLGRVVPIVTLGTPYRGDEDLGIAASVSDEGGGEVLVAELEQLLDVSLDPPPQHRATESRDDLEVDARHVKEGPTYHSTEIPTVRPEAPERDPDEQLERRTRAERERADLEASVEHPGYVIEPLDAAPERDSGGTRRQEGEDPMSPPEPAGAEAIRRKLEEVRHEDYFSVLEVSRGVEGSGVREAYRRLKRRFDPERLGPEDAEAFESELAEIHDALADARAVLADVELREAYRSRTSSGGS